MASLFDEWFAEQLRLRDDENVGTGGGCGGAALVPTPETKTERTRKCGLLFADNGHIP
jgi:hypothetical protein